MLLHWFNKHILPKLKFALSGLTATSLDYGLYILLVNHMDPVVSNVISYSSSVCLNFVLQKTFIFRMQRGLLPTLGMSVLFSLLGLGLSTLLIFWFNRIELFSSNQYIIKLIVTGVVFFYNFYTKRYAFERR